MKLTEFKNILLEIESVNFRLEDGSSVPSHYHITEVGQIKKHFIDCGGTIRKEEKVSFQLFTAEDYDHRLLADKILKIIELSEASLGIQDDIIEVEYQADTIGKYGLEFDGDSFVLTQLQTDCLAKDNCGIPTAKKKVELSSLSKSANSCTPGGGCC